MPFLRLYSVCVVFITLMLALSRGDSKLRLCHEIECPEDAVSCTKVFEASADNKKLITKFICDGSEGDVLLSKVIELDNKQWATKVHQPYKITKKFLVI